MATATVVLLNPGDQAIVTMDWSDALDTVSLASVIHIVPSPLTKLSEAFDVPGKASQVKVSGMVHGGLYLIQGSATLSNGESITRDFPVRAFNG